MSCEVCGGDGPEGSLVRGRAFPEERQLVQLCGACRGDVGAALAPQGRPVRWATVGWFAVAVASFMATLVTGVENVGHDHPLLHCLIDYMFGVITIGAGAAAYGSARAGRPEPPSIDGGEPRVPVRLFPDPLDRLSNTKLYERLQAVSDFPEEDFIAMRPNTKLARALSKQSLHSMLDQAIDRRAGQLVCPEPRANAVVTSVDPSTGWSIWA